MIREAARELQIVTGRAVLLRAAELLEVHARALRDAETFGDVWPDGSLDAKADHDEMMAVAVELRFMVGAVDLVKR